jgi:Cu(I)/Ag(I) efflux system protein CusF
MKPLLLAAVLSTFAFAAPAWSQAGQGHVHATTAPVTADPSQLDNSGEVRRVNNDTKRITIAHGPLKAFDMPAMTMGFPVKDPALLGKVKQGDKVKFALEKDGENLVISRIEAIR